MPFDVATHAATEPTGPLNFRDHAMRPWTTIALSFALLLGALPAGAFDSGVPAGGLPSASLFSSTLLPDVDGVVAWKTLGEVEPVARNGKLTPRFSDRILALDGTQVRMQGFILPMDAADMQRHFLISAVPPHCPFCMPAGPEAIAEVFARIPVAYRFEPVVLTGKLAVLKADPSGLLYRLSDAEMVRARPK